MTASGVPYTSAARITVKSGHGLGLAGALAPTLAVFAYKALAPLFFIVALGELALYWREHRRLPPPPMVAALLFSAFVLWGVIGAAWSLKASASLFTAGKLALMAALGLPLMSLGRELDPSQRRLVMAMSAGGLTAGLIFMAIEVFFGLPITHALYAVLHLSHLIYGNMLDPAATVLILIAAYVTGDLLVRRHTVVALVTAGAAIALSAQSQSMAAGVAGVIAIPVFLTVYWHGSVGRTFAIIAALAVLVAPLFPSRVLGPVENLHWSTDAIPSVYQRIGIWRFAEQKIDQRPALGWGLDAARRIPGGHDGIRANSFHIKSRTMLAQVTKYFDSGNIEQMPLHPHDAALQIWLEAGGIGAALTAGLIFVALFGGARSWSINRVATAAVLAFAIAALIIAGLSYGIWQTWWLATLFLGAAFSNIVLAKKPNT